VRSRPEYLNGAQSRQRFLEFGRVVKEWLVALIPQRLDDIFQPQSLFATSSGGHLHIGHVGPLNQLDPNARLKRGGTPPPPGRA
jgi:hypothetical protein